MSQRDSGGIQHQAEHTRSRRRSPPVMGYLLILFAAAFLLLLLAYFQQQRVNSETTDALKQSASAVQSIQNLIDENSELRERVEELERQSRDLTEQCENYQDLFRTADAEAAQLSEDVEAHRQFFRLDRLYRAQRFSEAAELIRQQANGGAGWSFSSLSDQPISTDSNETTPQARYQQICRQLLEWNYLKAEDVS